MMTSHAAAAVAELSAAPAAAPATPATAAAPESAPASPAAVADVPPALAEAAAGIPLARGAAARPLLSVAPMMDWTDVHFRQLARLLSKRTWLWTEMVVDKTVLHSPQLYKHLWFPPEQRPLVLQLGGSDPVTLAAAAAKAVSYGYDEINLNCGCPSDRVAGAGCFGAALMMQPALVAQCMAAMEAAIATATATAPTAAAANGDGISCGTDGSSQQQQQSPPVLSVKCRLGVDEADSYEQLVEFVRTVSAGSGVRHFIVHSRKAYLNGLSPHQNRTVPPLRHQWAWALARDFPHLQFTLNGGLQSCHDARAAILASHPAVPYTRSTALPPSHPAAAAAAVLSTGSPPPPPPAATAKSSSEQRAGGHGADASPSATAPAEAGSASGTSCNEGFRNGGGIEGVMIGRGAYNDPWGCLADADRAVYGEPYNPAPSRRAVLQQYCEYADAMVGRWSIKADGVADPHVRTLMRPLLNLFHGEPGCKRWKNAVDEVLRDAAAPPATVSEVLQRTLHAFPDEVLDSPPRQMDLGSIPAFALDPELPRPDSRAGHDQGPPRVAQPRRPSKAAAKAAAKASRRAAKAAGAASDADGCCGGAGHGEAEAGAGAGAAEGTASSGDEAEAQDGEKAEGQGQGGARGARCEEARQAAAEAEAEAGGPAEASGAGEEQGGKAAAAAAGQRRRRGCVIS